MQQRYYDPSIGRFLSMDPVGVIAGDPRTFNRYGYGANNPYRYTDPTGVIFETPWDVFNVGLGKASFATNVVSGNYVGAAIDAAGIVADVAATLTPGAPAFAGATIKAARAADEVGDVVSVAKRTGPHGLVPGRHNANVTVRGADGNIVSHERIVSSNMTPAEKALGFPKNTLASHTEARAVTNSALKPG